MFYPEIGKMRTRFAPANKKSDLSIALGPYAEHWADWIDSPACFLSIKEIALIHLYQKTGSYALCSNKLGGTIVTAANDLIRVMTRLKLLFHEFKEWEYYHTQEQLEGPLYVSEGHFLLNAPVYFLPLSQSLKTRLKLINEPDLFTILKLNSEIDLLAHWEMHPKELAELKKILDRHNLGYHLVKHLFNKFENSRSP